MRLVVRSPQITCPPEEGSPSQILIYPPVKVEVVVEPVWYPKISTDETAQGSVPVTVKSSATV